MLIGLGLQVVALTLAPVSVVQPVLAAGVLASWSRAEPCSVSASGDARASGWSWCWWRWPPSSSPRPGRHAGSLCSAGSVLDHGGMRRRAGGRRSPGVAGDPGQVAGPRTGPARRGGAGGGGRSAVRRSAPFRRRRWRPIWSATAWSEGRWPRWARVSLGVCGGHPGRAWWSSRRGLQRQPASLMVPLANVVASTCAIVGASVVFRELLMPVGWWSLPRWVAFAAVLVAVVVLAGEEEPRRRPGVGLTARDRRQQQDRWDQRHR